MPIFELDTNVTKESASRDVKPELAEAVASVVGVKAEKMSVTIRYGQDVSFARHQGEGKDRPCGNAKITSLVGLNAPNNKKLSAVVADILESGLGINKDRFYITFYYPGGGHNCGFNGGTLEGRY